MNEPDRGDDRADPIDTLLRAHAPAALSDDGFVARTMLAVARADATPARAVRPAPLSVARALVLEQRRYATQARLWRWAAAGVVQSEATRNRRENHFEVERDMIFHSPVVGSRVRFAWDGNQSRRSIPIFDASHSPGGWGCACL